LGGDQWQNMNKAVAMQRPVLPNIQEPCLYHLEKICNQCVGLKHLRFQVRLASKVPGQKEIPQIV